jgi:hypothetical protein
MQQIRANKLVINPVSYSMIKNSLIILLATGLLSCNQPAQKQPTANTAKTGAADTTLTDKSIVDDSAADKLISSDTSTMGAVASDRLILPGKGVGHILIDQDLELALKQLGKPDSSDAAMGSSLMVWFAKHDTKGYRTSIYSHRNMGGKDESISRVQKILVTSPWFKTAGHLGVGAALEAVKKDFSLKPVTRYKANGHNVQVYTDADKGISFEVDDVTKKCVAVVVHKAHEATSAYINMH